MILLELGIIMDTTYIDYYWASLMCILSASKFGKKITKLAYLKTTLISDSIC